jgi:putative DNA-invertase from lambdoid prophage Rac
VRKTSTAFGSAAAIYHRVSSRDQDPRLARHELRQAASARRLEVVLSIEETGSGARNDRPGLRHLMAAVAAGKVGTVLVWKLDRFGRSGLDVLNNIRQLENAGVRFVATTQGIDVSPQGDAVSRLTLQVLAAVAEFERTLISECTLLGQAAARRAGKHIGRPRDPHGPDAHAVRRLREKGLQWADVARRLRCSVAMARRRHAEAVPPRRRAA